MTSSTKPEVHNVLHCRQMRTKRRPEETCIAKFVRFRRRFWGMPEDRHRDKPTDGQSRRTQ